LTKVLSVLLTLGSIATALLYANILHRIDAERLRGAALPAPEQRLDTVPAEAGTPPPRERHPARVDERLAAQAVARAEQLAVPKQLHGVFAYVVEAGDWVEDISRRFGVPLEVILDTHQMDREAVLYPGDVLCLPIIEYTQRVGLASWYGPGFDHRQGANGSIFHEDEISVAALHYPFNLRLEIERRDNRKKIAVQVLDRGPYFEGRIIDLSRGAARALETVHDGVVEVVVKPMNGHLAVIDQYLAGRSPVAMRGT
jgi:hypothetical protein